MSPLPTADQHEEDRQEEEREETEEEREAREAEERERSREYLNWRRDLDHLKRQHEGTMADSDKLKKQGNDFFSLGLYSQASLLYSEAIELQPENAVLYCNRSMAYLKQDMPLEALEDAEKSLEIDNSLVNIKAHWRKAQALHDMSRWEESVAAAETGMVLQPGNAHLNRIRKKARESVALRQLTQFEWVGKIQHGIEKRMRFEKDGSMLMTVFGHKVMSTFDLSVECTPQSMLVKMKPDGPGGAGPPPPPMPYIFEFHDDGKELWLCHPVGTSDLPTRFDGPGFDRLRQASTVAIEDIEEMRGEPLDSRCAAYMREMNDAMPLNPPQLPAQPNEGDINAEMVLMDKMSKMRHRFGMDVHKRSLELARDPALADDTELKELATGLQRRYVSRKILPRSVLDGSTVPKANGEQQQAASGSQHHAAGDPQLQSQQQRQTTLKRPVGSGRCLGGVLARLCGN
mmetsp:Transcript_13125/g.25342  ORF Transcript_13125/g.25342 Transcript_13125/m.25342 type:complete len:459 (-) Transcript_13125:81-1457(-)